jgi:hypothetical protein
MVYMQIWRVIMPEDQEVLPCAEKLTFDTKKEAEAAALVANYQHGARLKVYVCTYCGLWHLSSDYR